MYLSSKQLCSTLLDLMRQVESSVAIPWQLDAEQAGKISADLRRAIMGEVPSGQSPKGLAQGKSFSGLGWLRVTSEALTAVFHAPAGARPHSQQGSF
jgi:hypothetical protein